VNQKLPPEIKRCGDIIAKKSDWTTQEIKNPKPSLEELKQGQIAVREDVIRKILDDILKRTNISIVVGPHDSGKTWLCYALCYEIEHRRKKTVRYVEVDEDLQAEDILKSIKELSWVKYWIFDECQNNKTEVEEIIREIKQSNLTERRFIFVIRKAKGFLTQEDGTLYYIDRKNKCKVSMGGKDKYALDHIKAIIKSFIDIKQVNDYIKITEGEINEVAKSWSYNLYAISTRLRFGWNYRKGMKLSEIKEYHLYNWLWSPSGKVRLDLSDRQKILLTVSAICQFEPLMVWSPFIQRIDPLTAKRLEDEGIIDRKTWREKDFYIISKGDAELYLKAVSYKLSSQFVNKEVKRIIKEYISSRPPNWMYVFYDLYLERHDVPAAVEILSYLLRDREVWELVKTFSKDATITDVLPFLEALFYVDKEKKYSEFWAQYIENRGIKKLKEEVLELKSTTQYLYRLYRLLPFQELKDVVILNLIERFRKSTAHKINEEMQSLYKDWKIDLVIFFNSFSLIDWINIFNRSTLKSIRTLLGNFILHRKLIHTPFIKKFCEALADNRIKWNKLIHSKNASLYRLNGLLQLVDTVDRQFHTSYAKKILKILSQIDLNDVFSREVDSKIREKKSKSKIINDFHAQVVKVNAWEEWEKILSNINDETLGEVFYSSDAEQNFWLLWIIYRYDTQRAAQLAKKYISLFKKLLDKIEDHLPKKLAFIGILNLCNINIKKVKINKIDVNKVKQILYDLKNIQNPPCTQIILILKGIKPFLSREKFLMLKEILNETKIKNCIENNLDFQVRNILKRLSREL